MVVNDEAIVTYYLVVSGMKKNGVWRTAAVPDPAGTQQQRQ